MATERQHVVGFRLSLLEKLYKFSHLKRERQKHGGQKDKIAAKRRTKRKIDR
jgi:hypothetical protein